MGKDKKKATLITRVTNDVKQRVMKAAEKRGVYEAEWLRAAIHQALLKDETERQIR